LLFGNSDRHEGNILFKNEPGQYRAYGIDHDRCLQGFSEELKLDYTGFDLSGPFDINLRELMSEGYQAKYEELLRIHDMSEEVNSWMRQVIEMLNEAMDKRLPIKQVITQAMSLWQERLGW
jgi:hypothetical protein